MRLALEQPLPKALHLETDGDLSVFYVTFDHLSESAKIVLVEDSHPVALKPCKP